MFLNPIRPNGQIFWIGLKALGRRKSNRKVGEGPETEMNLGKPERNTSKNRDLIKTVTDAELGYEFHSAIGLTRDEMSNIRRRQLLGRR